MQNECKVEIIYLDRRTTSVKLTPTITRNSHKVLLLATGTAKDTMYSRYAEPFLTICIKLKNLQSGSQIDAALSAGKRQYEEDHRILTKEERLERDLTTIQERLKATEQELNSLRSQTQKMIDTQIAEQKAELETRDAALRQKELELKKLEDDLLGSSDAEILAKIRAKREATFQAELEEKEAAVKTQIEQAAQERIAKEAALSDQALVTEARLKEMQLQLQKMQEMVEERNKLIAEIRSRAAVGILKGGIGVLSGAGAGYLSARYLIPAIRGNEALRRGIVATREGIDPLIPDDVLDSPAGQFLIGLREKAQEKAPQLILNLSNDTINYGPGETGYTDENITQVWIETQVDREAAKPEFQPIREITRGVYIQVEGKNPGVDTGGFYYHGAYNNFAIGFRGYPEGKMEAKNDFREVSIDRGRPPDFIVREKYYSKTLTWMPLSIRPGEKPIGYSGVNEAKFRQNNVSGHWEVMTLDTSHDLVIYTGEADLNGEESAYLKRPPIESDSQAIMDMERLNPELKEIIVQIRDDPNLTPDEKTDFALALWRQLFHYDDGYNIDSNFSRKNIGEYTADLVNQGIGRVILLRSEQWPF